MAQHAKEIMDFKNYKDTNGGKRAVANDLIIQVTKGKLVEYILNKNY